MTPFQERMKESRKRKDQILRLAKKKISHQKIADEVKCSRAYVTQTIAAATKGKGDGV